MNLADIHRIWKNSVRLFFAPLKGAFKGALDEIRRVDRDVQAQRVRALRPPGAD